MTLPPGQYEIDGFPRFDTHLHRPPPAVPTDPAITISGAETKPFDLPLADLAALPRRELIADFHCVAGWSTTKLHWEGVAFETLSRMIIVPSLPLDTSVTHLVFGGLDGYRSIVSIEDALADDVLIAQHFNGQPLDGDHGAPEILDVHASQFPPVERLMETLPSAELTRWEVPRDCTDWFMAALWSRPELYLRPDVRVASSVWHQLPPETVDAAITRLEHDLATGAWDDRHGVLRTATAFDVGVRIVRAAIGSGAAAPG